MFRFNKSACLAALTLLKASQYDLTSDLYNYEYLKYSSILLLADTISLLRYGSIIIGGIYVRNTTQKHRFLNWELVELKTLENVIGDVDELSYEETRIIEEAQEALMKGEDLSLLENMNIYGSASEYLSEFLKTFEISIYDILANNFLDEMLDR